MTTAALEHETQIAPAPQPQPPWMKIVASPRQRREPRFPMEYRVRVGGFDRCGRRFAEETVTLDISANGCRLRLRTPVHRGAFVAIGKADDQSARPIRALYSVVWFKPVDGGYEMGLERFTGPNIWGFKFPDLPTGNW